MQKWCLQSFQEPGRVEKVLSFCYPPPSMMLPLPLPDDTISSLCTPTRVVLVGNPWASPPRQLLHRINQEPSLSPKSLGSPAHPMQYKKRPPCVPRETNRGEPQKKKGAAVFSPNAVRHTQLCAPRHIIAKEMSSKWGYKKDKTLRVLCVRVQKKRRSQKKSSRGARAR